MSDEVEFEKDIQLTRQEVRDLIDIMPDDDSPALTKLIELLDEAQGAAGDFVPESNIIISVQLT